MYEVNLFRVQSDHFIDSTLSFCSRKYRTLSINDAKERCLTGTIVVSVEYLDSEVTQDPPRDTQESLQGNSDQPADTHELRRDDADAALTRTKDLVKQQVGPGSLFEKVGKLQDKLEKLDGIVSAIDELAKVLSFCSATLVEYTNIHTVAFMDRFRMAGLQIIIQGISCCRNRNQSTHLT